ncbi:MAG: efflux RND transporter periplasmic adaptor subunit [Desulfarculaceae bacterium]|nr:efflux RND transporter periplasmic adaptor subunit [Desulfarculaceae bacterium]
MNRYTGFFILFFMAASVSGVSAASGDNAANVVTAKTKQVMSAETARMNGTVYFEEISLVSAEISGKAERTFFEQGDVVRKGQKLVSTDTILLEKELAYEQFQLDELEVRIKKAKKDVERYATLFEKQAASESSYDDLKFDYEAMLEQKSALEKKIEMTRIKIEKSSVYSPVRGVVIEKMVEEGNWVAPGNPVARIGALDSVSVKIPVSEKFVRFSSKGDTITVFLTAFNKTLEGKVIGFMPYADSRTKNLYLKVKLDYTGFVAENMSAAADVPTGPEREVLTLPRDALVSYQGKDMVYTVKEGKAVPIPVDVIGYSGDNAQLTDGSLSEGTAVVVDGNERLKPDQAVKIVREQ